jgi:hypothetical protein
MKSDRNYPSDRLGTLGRVGAKWCSALWAFLLYKPENPRLSCFYLTPNPMASSSQSEQPIRFTRRAASDSICMTCYATIRPANGESLEEAERRHAQECPCSD